ncbi:MAG: hypothetical protein IJV90_04905 [Candidatus Methanomethylophilaceae archaeon]|nr:hypothetical protein [Candidatus Methanomethylophilaceae archaeon]
MSRESEDFGERLRRSIGYDDMRLMSTASLERNADPEVVNRFREDIFKQQSQGIRKMTIRSGTDAEMEKYRATKGDYGMDPREFALYDNVAVMYFNFYGENFEGGAVMDNPDDGYTCPWCKLKYEMSLKQMPDNCMRCGSITPLGRMRKDGVFRR